MDYDEEKRALMTVVATYKVDMDIYHDPNIKHDVSLTTTEYICGNDILVHLQMGKNFGIRLNNLMQYQFKGSITGLTNDQFMTKKTYGRGKPKSITKSTFEEKRKRFDMSQTTMEQEILEEYAYIDKAGHPGAVQIVITIKDGVMSAVISFKDSEQYQNSILPAWLMWSP
jgi:hypothetical protein